MLAISSTHQQGNRAIASMPSTTLAEPRTINIHDRHIRSVAINDIVMLEGDGNYTLLYLRNGKKVLVSKTLKQFEDLLKDDCFVRVHKSYLINLCYLTTYNLKTDMNLWLENGWKVEVSRRRRKDFEEKMLCFLSQPTMVA
jgi:two-component system, LytTR family, response regulator